MEAFQGPEGLNARVALRSCNDLQGMLFGEFRLMMLRYSNLDGEWNVMGLPPRPRTNSTVAEWAIEQATVTIRLEQPEGKPTEIALKNTNGTLVPSGRRRFLISGRGQFDLSPLRLAPHRSRFRWIRSGFVPRSIASLAPIPTRPASRTGRA